MRANEMISPLAFVAGCDRGDVAMSRSLLSLLEATLADKKWINEMLNRANSGAKEGYH